MHSQQQRSVDASEAESLRQLNLRLESEAASVAHEARVREAREREREAAATREADSMRKEIERGRAEIERLMAANSDAQRNLEEVPIGGG